MKFKLLTAAVALVITQSAFAATQQQPTSCPSVDAFKSTGVSTVMQGQNGKWAGFEWKNNFGTNQEWTFAVGEFVGQNPNDILVEANLAIHTLSLVDGPSAIDGTNAYVCLYQGQTAEGIAITPAISPDMNQISKYLRRK